MFYINFRLAGDENLSRVLEGVSTKLKNFREPLQKSGTLLLKDIQINFDKEGEWVGGWQPLKPATVQQRKRLGFGGEHPILHRTGAYKRSFRGQVSGTRLVIDSGVPYHKYHQSSAPRTKLPRRKTMFIREDSRREIVRYFQEYIKFN
jgi:phage gpG-like protein